MAEESGLPQKMTVTETPGKQRWNIYAIGCTFLASISSILLGYDTGVMSGAAIFMQDDLKLTDTEISLIVGIINLYSLIGSAAAGRMSDWIGRKKTLFVAAVIFFIGAVILAVAPNFGVLMLGRFVAGLGVGYGLMIAPVYTTELSPDSSRGTLTSLPEIFINFGVLLGYVANFAFAKLPLNLGWRFMLGAGAIPPVALGLGSLIMPESPRWLVMRGRIGEARQVLIKTSDDMEEAEGRLANIKAAFGIPDDAKGDVISVPKHKQGGEVWKEIMNPSPAVRRVLIAALGIQFFQQASGVDAVVLYSPRIFEKAGIKNKDHLLGATIGVGCSKTVSILISTFFLDRLGRRPILLSSTGGMVIALSTLTACLVVIDKNPDKKIQWAIVLCIIAVLAFVGFFSMGLGPISWVYSSEIYPMRLRAQGASLGVAVNRLISSLIGMTFISMYKAMTIGGTFFLFTIITVISWIFFYTSLPETQGKTLEELETFFERPGDKARKEAAAKPETD